MRYMKNVGDLGEQLAADMLKNSGYRIIMRNYAVRDGEIDIIAIKDGVLHFVEVKTRKGDDYGFPSDAVTPAKQKRIKKAANTYLSSRRGHWQNVSFDVYEVMINHIENCL
ncbi:MAG: YraN family protein [Mogibacterium sp.]|nr:YraN family protein [Mogibacterium sp.]